MAQKPIHEMSHKPGRMSEDADYALMEMKEGFAFIDKLDLPKIKNQLSDLIKDYQFRIVDQTSISEIVQSINICQSKIDKLTEAILTLAQKLDVENVTNLDTNYETIVQEQLD